MNPADYGMFWMNQYSQDRMILEDNPNYYSQPSIGMSVMDDISHQTSAMDMNPMGLISEYTAATAPGPIAITPDLTFSHHTHHGFPDDHHQTVLDHYGTLAGVPGDLSGNISIGINVGIGCGGPDESDDPYDDDNADSNRNSNNSNSNNNGRQHFDVGVGGDDQLILHQTGDDMIDDDDMGALDDNENSNDHELEIDEYEGGDGDSGVHVARTATSTNFPYKKKTKSTQTNRKIKPVKRPGLVLKTPIAYQPCLDPSVIPIQRDGMAVCERCGAIGVKHSFYTKERRFCSMACARGDYLMQMRENNVMDESNTEYLNSKSAANAVGKTAAASTANAGSNAATTAAAAATSTTATGIGTDIELELTSTHVQNPNFRFKLAGNGFSDGNGTSSIQHPLHIDTNHGDVDNITDGVLYRDLLPEDGVPQIPKAERLPSPCPQDEKIITVRRKPSEFYNSYDWNAQLSDAGFFAAPVTCFKHAPGFDMWANIGIGMKVEVENTDCDTQGMQQGSFPHSFWVATVLRLCGYKALLRYEGFDSDSSHDFWVNLCSSEVHPVGWCATRGKPLIPPRTIENKYSDWKDLLVKRLSGARTLPSTFYNKINDSLRSRFRPGLQLEVVDKNRISQVRLATVHKIVGKRLLVRYYDAPEDNGFWVHEDSPLIHPVGWATTVGHNLSAPSEYLERMLAGLEQTLEVHEDDATMELFKMNFTFEEYYLEGKTSGFEAGMKLEAVDPLNLSSICVATVMEVLKFGYMMIRIDSYDPDITGADLFCYHEKSPCIFPAGFCERNEIVLTPPKGYESGQFTWEKYLRNTRSIAARENLFHRETINMGFCTGMKIECADLMDPRLVCVATIAKTVGRLLKIHFDGWEDEYDQWLDSQSPDMYPVGWCVLVGHKLEGPPPTVRPVIAQKISPKTTKKKGRKKKIKNEGKPAAKGNIVKKEKGKTDQDKHMEDEIITSNGDAARKRNAIKSEQSVEQHFEEDEANGDEDDDEDDDDFSHDGYSHSVASGQSRSLPPTPEPRNSTPTLQLNRPSSKASQLSTTSLQSGTTSSSISPKPPSERKATSYISNSPASCGKLIPRVADTTVNNLTSSNSSTSSPSADSDLCPDTWNIYDVGQFLRVNDCAAHCDIFIRKKVDGKRLLELTKDEIVEMLNMKVGPALKIYDMIQQLKCKIKPANSRLTSKTSVKKKFL